MGRSEERGGMVVNMRVETTVYGDWEFLEQVDLDRLALWEVN